MPSRHSAEQALAVPSRHLTKRAEQAQAPRCRAGTVPSRHSAEQALAVPSRHLSRRAEQALVDVPSRHSAKQAQALATVKAAAAVQVAGRCASGGGPLLKRRALGSQAGTFDAEQAQHLVLARPTAP